MKPKLLVIGDGVAPTGYSRVIEGILRNVPAHSYEIHHLAVNYDGDPHELPWKVYPASNAGHLYGVNRIPSLIEKIKPQIVLTVADLWIQKLYLKALSKHAETLRLIAYSPVDAGPVDPEWVEDFGCLSRMVLFTEYAKAEVLKAFRRQPRETCVIPPGVDSSTFYPFEGEGTVNLRGVWDTRPAKLALGLFEEETVANSFLVLNAHRNQIRKRIDTTLKGFALFAKDKPPNVQLYLHMGVEDVGWNVAKLAERYAIFDRLILSENTRSIPGIASSHLNLVYNACDVGISTATGEGWGLPNFEHAATGKAQVVPRFGALSEIWSNAAEFLEPTSEIVYEGVLSEGKAVSPESLARALNKLYRDPKYRACIGQSCHQVATSPQYDWQAISQRWHLLFQEVLSEPPSTVAPVLPEASRRESLNRVKQCRHGSFIYNVHDTYVGRSLDAYGEWSEKEVELFASLIKPGDAVLDVGSNIGAFTIFFAQAVGPHGTVFAFEPQRVVFQMLCANIALNSIANVRASQVAVGESGARVVVPPVDYESEGNFGSLSVLREGPGEPVDLIKIDDLALDRCDFIKIDVEGMEIDVLRGARTTISRHCPILYVENDRVERSYELISWLEGAGYRLYWHIAPYYQRDNYLQNAIDVFPNTCAMNMLCLSAGHSVDVSEFEAVLGREDTWEKAIARIRSSSSVLSETSTTSVHRRKCTPVKLHGRAVAVPECHREANVEARHGM